ncbi:MAG TPA: tyrosine--tRNA ligase [Saprospiraceae bacterium]|nr:tyrosine--tRNA ligase [Saprospiraceae bacterium]
MDFLEELTWRGLIHDKTPGIDEELAGGMKLGYIGFDPTAPSMTIGNYVQIMLLKFFQLSGHKPVVLMGGATGRIGDPSGKDKERTLKSYEELDNNLAHQQRQLMKFLEFEKGENKAVVVNNLDFYNQMNVLDFLRDVGKNLTINYMMSKDSVKNRIERGLSFTEFSYQLLQGYDFAKMNKEMGVTVEMGGSDQYGNITAGIEMSRKLNGTKVFAVTTPLLTKADGSKFGKSEGGNIWLDPKLTSPYRFYQFWLNANDADLATYYRYFSLRKKEEILELEANYKDDPQSLKRLLAEELTVRIHSQEDFDAVLRVTKILFDRKASKEQLRLLDAAELALIGQEIPSFEVSLEELKAGMSIVTLLSTKTNILSSNSEVRKALKNRAISVNKEKITSHETIINAEHLLHDQYMMIENGKKNKFMIIAK